MSEIKVGGALVKVLPKEFIASKGGVIKCTWQLIVVVVGCLLLALLLKKNPRGKPVRNIETSWLIALRLRSRSNGLTGRGCSIRRGRLVARATIGL